MENYFQMNMPREQIDAISNLGLAHIGDGVFELLCRSYLCARGDRSVRRLHMDAVHMVNAASQAKYAQALLPHLTQGEMDYFRRGRNAHTHAAPKAATGREYALATGLETLFGALYLAGETARLNELFHILLEVPNGI